MRRIAVIALLAGTFAFLRPLTPQAQEARSGDQLTALDLATRRAEDDLAALRLFRPAYPFWQHIFTVPDGRVIYGSAVDGRLLATFPLQGDWKTQANWADPSLANLLDGQSLDRRVNDRRDQVAQLMEPVVGPVLHNATRGLFLRPNERRYGTFLEEWGRIYERFAVPAEVGLAQAIVESGLNGTVRSEARAIGFCQWLAVNWNRLKRLSPHVIEGYNQTTQAPYCAAYLTILATKYGSFIPALSEHHTGGVNVGRTLINGERLGGVDVRERYFLGAEFARDLRALAPGTFRTVYGSYGPRSFYYAEMVYGNAANVRRIKEAVPQQRIFAMRTSRAIPLAEVARRAGISTEEARRFNPALVRSVPKGATVYLPKYVESFGPDVSFWHRPPSREYSNLLAEFVSLNVSIDEWESRAFDATLRDFQRRFRATRTEEGTVMATTLAYVLEDRARGRQAEILADFRTNPSILKTFEEARQRWDSFLLSSAGTESGGIQ